MEKFTISAGYTLMGIGVHAKPLTKIGRESCAEGMTVKMAMA
jgi:hypothetical protein